MRFSPPHPLFVRLWVHVEHGGRVRCRSQAISSNGDDAAATSPTHAVAGTLSVQPLPSEWREIRPPWQARRAYRACPTRRRSRSLACIGRIRSAIACRRARACVERIGRCARINSACDLHETRQLIIDQTPHGSIDQMRRTSSGAPSAAMDVRTSATPISSATFLESSSTVKSLHSPSVRPRVSRSNAAPST